MSAPLESHPVSDAQLLDMTQDLLDSIDNRDWPRYQELCDDSLTAFEPEAAGHLVEGMGFHEFYLAGGPDGVTRQSTISSPHVRRLAPVAIVSYVRLVQVTTPEGHTSTTTMEETRVWHEQESGWQHVHFHRSPAGTHLL
ncbi:MAG TPA: DUF4440 domain-containing protein [Planctomycetaceae bacterium]|nr:DUF4440 domain-containing protein [Planctomycetaceae bacterium]HCK53151.1 DUF4440 domain-containing protein [Planctomycetaceae bacterium]